MFKKAMNSRLTEAKEHKDSKTVIYPRRNIEI